MMRLRVGYVPLTDAAILIAAAECGFAARQGLELDVVRETSWANIRDKLVFGLFDAAHMLGPLAIATTVGRGQVARPLAVPFALNLGGNAVTVSNALADHFEPLDGDFARAARGIQAAARARMRAATGAPPLTFGTVFPFSTHTYLLRQLFAAAGLSPDNDVRLAVIPPPFMVEALRSGLIDGFCVGSPWNSVAVEEGVGRILLLGQDIAPKAPEKVLAVPAETVDSAPVAALIRALAAASDWCSDPENHEELARRLSATARLDLPASVILRSIRGSLAIDRNGHARENRNFLALGGAGVGRPRNDDAQWLIKAMLEAGHLSADAAADAAAIYRPDVYDRAVGI